METKFQTSFVPRKPIVPVGGATMGVSAPPKKHFRNSLFMSIATLFFIISLLGAGGVYAWKSYLLSAQETYKKQLTEREKQFNPDLIEELRRMNIKIDAVRNIMDKHIAVSGIFNILGKFVAENVRFISMDLTNDDKDSDGIKVNMRGYGTGLTAVAFQSDVLGRLEDYGLRKIVRSPMLSEPSQNTGGAVSFGLSATIDPGILSYTKKIKGDSNATTTNP